MSSWERTLDAVLARAEAEKATASTPTAPAQPAPAPAPQPEIESLLNSVARVESNFNPLARSPKGALGMYQFMPETAKRFGLRIGAVDDRTDPAKSRLAAAQYLRFLHGTFNDWSLALAAYNAGEGRVQAAIDRAGTRDFSRLARFLPRETRDYVPAVLRTPPVAAVEESILFAPFSLSP